MTDLERAPILRVMPGPGDINANGHIFGGWVLSQMDIAAGIVASRRAQGPGRDGRDRGDEVHRADPPARPDLGLCRGRAGRPHVDGGAGSRWSPHRDLGATEVKVTEGAVHLRRAGRGPPAAAGRYRSLGGRRDLVFALGRARRAGAAARRGAALRRAGFVACVAADRRRKHVERKAVVAAVDARPALLAIARRRRRRGRRGGSALRRSNRSVRTARSPRSWRSWRSGRSSLDGFVAGLDHLLVALVLVHVVVALAARVLVLEAGAAFAEHAEIMVRDTGDNIRSGRGRPRAARRAPCSCIFRAAGRHCRAGDCPGGCPAVRRGSGPRLVPHGRAGGRPVDY